MHTYKITGQLIYTESDSADADENGHATISIDDTIEIETKSARKAFEAFTDDMQPAYHFNGYLKHIDSNTGGKMYASYYDQAEGNHLEIELAEEA